MSRPVGLMRLALAVLTCLLHAAMVLGGGPGTDLWPLTQTRAEVGIPISLRLLEQLSWLCHPSMQHSPVPRQG